MTSGVLGKYGVEDIAMLNDILREASVQYSLAQSVLTETNKRQEDILHEIEFGNHRNRELVKLAKDLKDVRSERRLAKNTIQLIGPILKWEEDNRAAYNKISNVIATTRKIDKEQKEAVYHIKTGDKAGEIIEHVD